ncbi:MAG: HAMP domain-containing histidine kinase [Oscillospiraceae bacterium]|jgi:signal transduction histidine kinase|nr:HAMP domain-containing histidine kinase [Oscillospiraceae bacterium]
MQSALIALCAALAAAVLLLIWKIALMRRAAEEIRRGLDERLEMDTNTLLSVSSQDKAMRLLAAGLNRQLRLLRQQRQRYQQGDQALKEAVAGMSHDLRTPLTAICGYLDLLEGEGLGGDAARYLALIRSRTDHLRELTEEFFQYAVSISGKAPEMDEVRLDRALEESLAAWYAVLSARGIAPEVSLPDAPVVRRLDAAALSRVLGNILSNAVKYSAGDLAVSLDSAGTLTFSNSAPRMTQVLAQQLFDRYFTLETGRHAAGLGLSIARQLTEQLGGTISAQCQDGRLTVTVHFP